MTLMFILTADSIFPNNIALSSIPQPNVRTLVVVSAAPKQDETMSRPQSVTEGHGSTFSLTKKAGHRSIGTSNIALFLANLRLLDLDLRSDWPRISARDFDTRDVHQNQKRRITCVEWALYRLFEIWDRPTTRDVRHAYIPAQRQIAE